MYDNCGDMVVIRIRLQGSQKLGFCLNNQIFYPPLQVRTDICTINDLFGFWARYKISIILNYSDSHTLRMHAEHLNPTSEMISRCKNAIASLMD